jgi:hypothetical protein
LLVVVVLVVLLLVVVEVEGAPLCVAPDGHFTKWPDASRHLLAVEVVLVALLELAASAGAEASRLAAAAAITSMDGFMGVPPKAPPSFRRTAVAPDGSACRGFRLIRRAAGATWALGAALAQRLRNA